jgi:hypothetical protein
MYFWVDYIPDCAKSQKIMALNTADSAISHLLLYVVVLMNFIGVFAQSEFRLF